MAGGAKLSVLNRFSSPGKNVVGHHPPSLHHAPVFQEIQEQRQREI